MQISSQMIPELKPRWLSLWPAKKDYSRDFPDGIRLHYLRTKSPQVTSLQFHNNGISATLDGSFRVQWLSVEDEWTHSCSCNYPKDTCVHSWYLTVIVEYACRLRGWNTAAVKKVDSPKVISPRKIDETLSYSPSKVSKPSEQLELPFGVVEESGPINNELVVEVDFLLNPGQVTLRFYKVTKGRRAILRMQQLFNLSQQAVMKKTTAWHKKDVDFLVWLRTKIDGKHVWRDNLQVLKLLPGKFEDWVHAWRHDPTRFTDRETQRPLALKVAAGLQFELIVEGAKTRIKCYVATSAENREEFHRVFPEIREKKKCLLNGVMLNLDLSVSWQTLVDCFSKKSPAMPTEMVCEHLPVLLEKRLDLLCGENVKHVNKLESLELRVSAREGELVFDVTRDGILVSETGYCAAHMDLVKDVFEVTSTQSDVLDALKKVPGQMNPGGEEVCRFPQSERLMQRLVEVWDLIDVPKTCSANLEGLLSTGVRPQMELSLKENRNWLDYSVNWKIANTVLSHEEMKYISSTDKKFYRSSGGDWFNIDMEDLRTSLKSLEDAQIHQGKGSRPAMEGRAILTQLGDIELAPSCRQLAMKIRSMPEPELPKIPPHLEGILRSYQKEGIEFLHHRLVYGLGAILADDMGLGKTLQTLALLGSMKCDKTAIVVAPASVVYVWLDEAKKFMPDLKVAVIAGNKKQRDKVLRVQRSYDLLITSYHLVRNDLDSFISMDFSLVILDEAQVIKNPAAKITKAVKRLRSDHRLALSGTPVENRLTDLWSIFDFLNPGFLGSLERFTTNYEEGGAPRQELAAKVKPLILRRTKEKVASELPPRTVELVRCSFEDEQSELYLQVLQKSRAAVKQEGFSIFAALTHLRQVSCDPRLLKDRTADYDASHSVKLKRLMSMVGPIIEEGHSILVFSQFTSMLALIEEELAKAKMKNFKLTGQTPTIKRPALIKEFNDCPEASVFLLSLKAAGTGLTLTKADYVFLFDPWWNPAAEQQAIDRTHRIGQDKPVFVYKLVARNSVEDKILLLQEKKKQMVAEILDDDGVPGHFTASELAGLLEDF